MQNIDQLRNDYTFAVAALKREADTLNRHELAARATSVKVVGMALSAALAEGASPCPVCGAAPIGMFQPSQELGEIVEVGCINCRHHRARGGDSAGAVTRWNKGCDSYVAGQRVQLTLSGAVSAVPNGWFLPRAK